MEKKEKMLSYSQFRHQVGLSEISKKLKANIRMTALGIAVLLVILTIPSGSGSIVPASFLVVAALLCFWFGFPSSYFDAWTSATIQNAYLKEQIKNDTMAMEALVSLMDMQRKMSHGAIAAFIDTSWKSFLAMLDAFKTRDDEEQEARTRKMQYLGERITYLRTQVYAPGRGFVGKLSLLAAYEQKYDSLKKEFSQAQRTYQERLDKAIHDNAIQLESAMNMVKEQNEAKMKALIERYDAIQERFESTSTVSWPFIGKQIQKLGLG